MIIALIAETCAIAVAVIALTLGFVVLLTRLLRSVDRGTDADDGGESDSGGGGGGGSQRRRPRPPSGPGGEPAWWPEFEHEFARHVASAPRQRSKVG